MIVKTSVALLVLLTPAVIAHAQSTSEVRSGKAAFGGWREDAPGVRRHITIDALPKPNPAASASNTSRVAPKPPNAQLKVPAGFEIKEFASGLRGPRQMRVAP